MLIEKKKGIIRILSIDPSTSHMGISFIDINTNKYDKFKLIYSKTIHGDNVNYNPNFNNDDNGYLSRVDGLCKSLTDLIELFDPDEVICEDNYQGRNVSTFKILVTVMVMLRESVIKKNLYFDTVYPNLAKETVKANFKGTTKDDVLKGVKEYANLEILDKNINLDLLDDHAIDSIAIGLYKAEKIVKYLKLGSYL